MTITFNDVARRKPFPETGRHDGPPYERQPHLATVSMTGKRKRNAIGNEWKNVGTMCHQNHRRAIVLDSGQCGRDVMPTGPQVTDARDPYTAGGRTEARSRLLENANAVSLEGVPHAIVVQPSVVVAQHGDDTGPRAKPLQFSGDLFGSNEASTDHTLNYEVTKNTDDVWSRGIRAANYFAKLGHAVERRPHMKVGQYCDSEMSLPGRAQADSLLDQGQTRRLDPEPPQAKGNHQCCDDREAPEPGSSTHRAAFDR